MKISCAGAIAGGEVGRERQPAFAAVPLHEFEQARLVDRQLARVERLDLRRVVVDADDVVAALGEAGRRDEADVPGADDRDFHSCHLFLGNLWTYHADAPAGSNAIAKPAKPPECPPLTVERANSSSPLSWSTAFRRPNVHGLCSG